MSRTDLGHPRALVVVFTGVVAITLLSAVTMASAAPELGTPTLTLDPVEGPPGISVTATATGFDDCPLAGNDDVGNPDVTFEWDDDGTSTELETTSLSSGSAEISFPVPIKASPQIHTVRARCTGDDDMVAVTSFNVIPDVAIVPDLGGLSREDAATSLEAAGLVLGSAEGSGEVAEEKVVDGEVVRTGR